MFMEIKIAIEKGDRTHQVLNNLWQVFGEVEDFVRATANKLREHLNMLQYKDMWE